MPETPDWTPDPREDPIAEALTRRALSPTTTHTNSPSVSSSAKTNIRITDIILRYSDMTSSPV
jgi:hypothetical protein